MSRKNKTYHYAVLDEYCDGTDIIGITDDKETAQKLIENYNRINDDTIVIKKFRDIKEAGNIYLSKKYSENSLYYIWRLAQILSDGTIDVCYGGKKANLVSYAFIKGSHFKNHKDYIGKVEHHLAYDNANFPLLQSWIYLWAPNEEAARAAAYKAFEKNQFEVLKEYLENPREK